MTAYLANNIAQTAHRQRQHASNVIPSVSVGIPLNRNANLNGVLPRASLVLAITNRATTLHSQNEMDKNSNHNSVRVLAW